MHAWHAGLSVGRGDVNNTIGSMLAYARRSTRAQVRARLTATCDM